MVKSDLTVITVAANEKGFLDLMIKSVKRFTNPQPNFIICDNGKNGRWLKKYSKDKNITIVNNPRAYKYYLPECADAFGNTSIRHAAGLNLIYPMVRTKRTAIIEPDCVVTCCDWDKILDGKEMKACEKGIGINGEHYYYPCFMVFYTSAMNKNGIMSFSPGDKHKGIGILRSEDDTRRYGDVGWRVYEAISDDKVDKLSFVRANSPDAKWFNAGFSHKTNVFIDDRENIVAAHFWRGSDLARKNDVAKQKNMWFSVVEKIMSAGGDDETMDER